MWTKVTGYTMVGVEMYGAMEATHHRRLLVGLVDT